MTTLSLVVPCYNEEAIIDAFMAELLRVLDGLPDVAGTVLVIDDGSTDGSLARLNAIAARDPRVRAYALSRNFGHQIALTAGIDEADGDVLIMLDGDLQHPPSLIPRMLDAWRHGSDVVSTVRTTTAGASWFKRVTTGAFYTIFNLMSDTTIVPGAADFCLLSRRAYEALRMMPERHRFLRGMVSWIGFPRAVVPFEAPPRAAGTSKYTVFKMMDFAFDALFSFSATPIRLAGRAGTVIAASGAIYLIVILVRFTTDGDLVRGWGSLASLTLILGGMQLAFIGLIGQYLARVFEEAKQRPAYIFKQRPR